LFLSGIDFKGVKMNADGRLLGVGFEESENNCHDEIRSIPSKTQRMEASSPLPSGSPTNSCEAKDGYQSQSETKQNNSYLGARITQSLERPSEKSSTSIRKGNVGVRDENETLGYTPSQDVEVSKIVLRPVQVKELVNNAGFGNILSERQLFRYRKETPEMETDDGRIHLVRFIAALCKRRTRSRTSERGSNLPFQELCELLEKQDYRCALTGRELTPDDIAVDHIVPISCGGDFSIKNSQLVSKSVNRAKHTMSQEEFITLCRSVSETQRSKQTRICESPS
jgi:5-methylcytosine-specific restriction endonuclease McrA